MRLGTRGGGEVHAAQGAHMGLQRAAQLCIGRLRRASQRSNRAIVRRRRLHDAVPRVCQQLLRRVCNVGLPRNQGEVLEKRRVGERAVSLQHAFRQRPHRLCVDDPLAQEVCEGVQRLQRHQSHGLLVQHQRPHLRLGLLGREHVVHLPLEPQLVRQKGGSHAELPLRDRRVGTPPLPLLAAGVLLARQHLLAHVRHGAASRLAAPLRRAARLQHVPQDAQSLATTARQDVRRQLVHAFHRRQLPMRIRRQLLADLQKKGEHGCRLRLLRGKSAQQGEARLGGEDGVLQARFKVLAALVEFDGVDGQLHVQLLRVRKHPLRRLVAPEPQHRREERGAEPRRVLVRLLLLAQLRVQRRRRPQADHGACRALTVRCDAALRQPHAGRRRHDEHVVVGEHVELGRLPQQLQTLVMLLCRVARSLNAPQGAVEHGKQHLVRHLVLRRPVRIDAPHVCRRVREVEDVCDGTRPVVTQGVVVRPDLAGGGVVRRGGRRRSLRCLLRSPKNAALAHLWRDSHPPPGGCGRGVGERGGGCNEVQIL
eukprot:Rhum_TRINITY_DN3171_c0_g2::Rhum_TRINITY_DN3171_c0_g2_i1::g.9837::m.9837